MKIYINELGHMTNMAAMPIYFIIRWHKKCHLLYRKSIKKTKQTKKNRKIVCSQREWPAEGIFSLEANLMDFALDPYRYPTRVALL